MVVRVAVEEGAEEDLVTVVPWDGRAKTVCQKLSLQICTGYNSKSSAYVFDILAMST